MFCLNPGILPLLGITAGECILYVPREFITNVLSDKIAVLRVDLDEFESHSGLFTFRRAACVTVHDGPFCGYPPVLYLKSNRDASAPGIGTARPNVHAVFRKIDIAFLLTEGGVIEGNRKTRIDPDI